MPLLDRKSSMTSSNARASDNAARMVEHLVPLQQQRMAAAFRVSGIQGILYSHLEQGRICTCKTRESHLQGLSPDGKASTGTINRLLTGNSNFGVSAYKDTPEDDFEMFDDQPTSKGNPFGEWLGERGGSRYNKSEEPDVYDDGQDSPDLDDMMGDIDLGSLGITDVSCPICFGSGYIGGFSMLQGWRHVLVPADMDTHSVLDPLDFSLSPGTHTSKVVLPRYVTRVDSIRVMHKDQAVMAKVYLDGAPLFGQNILRKCDGLPHEFKIESTKPITHVELQFATTNESLYFEVPRISRSSDLTLLDQQDPFQIIVSPDVPILKARDVIAESQRGKFLIVQTVNEWNTRSRQMLGHEIMVRVAQPKELYNILPLRSKVASPRPVNQARPNQHKTVSGLSTKSSFTF